MKVKTLIKYSYQIVFLNLIKIRKKRAQGYGPFFVG